MRHTPFLFVILLLCANIPLAGTSVQVVRGDTVEIPFELRRNRVHVPVTVNERGPFDFMLDTGASGVGRLDDSLRVVLGVPVVDQEINFDGMNRSTIDVVEIAHLALGPMVRRQVRLLSRGYSMDGIIGRGYFEQDLLTIDFPNRVLRVVSGSLSTSDPHVVTYRRPLAVPVRVGSIETVGHVDTGSVLPILLPLAYADSLDTSDLVAAGVATSANTELQLYRATIFEPIVLAGNTLTNVDAVFSEQVPWVNIGSALLRDFAVSVDQNNRRIRIAPPNAHN